MSGSDESSETKMTPEPETEAEHDDGRRKFSRRSKDFLLRRALIGACVFLFIVNALFGTYIVTTFDTVKTNQRGLKTNYCLTTSAYRSALIREKRLVKTGPPSQRKVHKMSARDLEDFLKQINTVDIDCRGEPTINLRQQ